MKQIDSPCIKDRLTVHVPASNFKATHYNKNKSHRSSTNSLNKRLKPTETQSAANLFRNPRLQLVQSGDKFQKQVKPIDILYSNQRSNYVTKRNKVEIIPLLSNIRKQIVSKFNAQQYHKVTIVKQTHKNQYNLIFQNKAKPLPQGHFSQLQQKQQNRNYRASAMHFYTPADPCPRSLIKTANYTKHSRHHSQNLKISQSCTATHEIDNYFEYLKASEGVFDKIPIVIMEEELNDLCQREKIRQMQINQSGKLEVSGLKANIKENFQTKKTKAINMSGKQDNQQHRYLQINLTDSVLNN